MEQLSLFKESEYKVNFSVIETDSDYNVMVKENGIIQNRFDLYLNFNQLKKYYEKSRKVERLNYGYKFFFEECGRYYEIYARFGNMTTRKNEDIVDFMRRGFDWVEHDLWRTF